MSHGPYFTLHIIDKELEPGTLADPLSCADLHEPKILLTEGMDIRFLADFWGEHQHEWSLAISISFLKRHMPICQLTPYTYLIHHIQQIWISATSIVSVVWRGNFHITDSKVNQTWRCAAEIKQKRENRGYCLDVIVKNVRSSLQFLIHWKKKTVKLSLPQAMRNFNASLVWRAHTKISAGLPGF